MTRGPWLPQKGAFGTSGVTDDYKDGALLFLRESQGQKPVTTKKAQNRKAWFSIFGSASHRGLAHHSHCSRAFLPEFLQAWPCVFPVTMSGTAHSSWSPLRVASGVLLGSFRTWSGSASCCLGLAEGKASLVRSASLDARPLAPHASVSGPFSESLKLGASFLQFFSSHFEPVD